MAKKMMARTRLEKANVTECVFCGFERDVRNAYENKREELTKKYPDKSFYRYWDIQGKLDKENTFPGYCVTTMRTERKGDYNWDADENKLYKVGTVAICEYCMETLNKCFNAMGEAEENAYARKENKTFVLPTEIEMEEGKVEEE